MGIYTVYKHTAPNGKVYIGITSKKATKRWDNGKGYRDCPLMMRAIEKYGWENFRHEIVATGLSKQDAEAMEVELIREYRSNERVFGYNLESGGNACHTASEETRQKMREAHRGHETSAETRRKISEALKGRHLSAEHAAKVRAYAESRKGSRLPDETKQKISKALTGQNRSEEYRQHIREAHLGKIFHSEETKRKISETKKNSPSTPRGGANPKAHRVVCVETEEVFETLADAAKEKGIKSVANISRSCRNKNVKCGGYTWRYYEDFNSANKNE